MSVKMVQLYPLGDLREDLIAQAIARVVESGQYIGGCEVEAFEESWADYCGAQYCVGVSSGFSALQLIIRALDNEPVYYSSLTCPPTPLAIQEAGADTIPISPQIGEYVLYQRHLREGINVPVLLYGIIEDTREADNIIIVEDAAQAHGLHYRLAERAKHTTAAAWSFYPTKNLGAFGDAGAVTTNDLGLANEVRSLSCYGKRGGVNARLDPLQAAILRAKLPFLDADNVARLTNALLYLDMLEGLPIALPTDLLFCTNWHQFPIRTDKRDELQGWLLEHNIETQIHYPKAALLGMRVPTVWEDTWAKTVLSLPIGPHLDDSDMMYVSSGIMYVSETIQAYFEETQ